MSSEEPRLPVLTPISAPPQAQGTHPAGPAQPWAPVTRASRNRPAATLPLPAEAPRSSLTLAPAEAPEPAPPAPAFAPAPAQVFEPAAPASQPSIFEPAVPAPQPSIFEPAAVAAPVPAVEVREPMKPLSELVARRDSQDFRELFRDLVSHGVSDAHMTRSVLDDTFTVKARLDGVMQTVHTYKGVQAQTITTLIKTESKMSSGENLVPEDGNYELPIDGYPYRARAVALPLFDGGERIVFRLPQIGEVRPLDQLGFTEANLRATKELLDIPGGMTVFAGPTGEGKSTTSLGALKYLRGLVDDGVFITLEDPVERIVPGFAQIEVNEDVEGAGFADFMKYLVRADTNVLFIGEIRHSATATAAVELAKSGVRVIATIHARNNISAFLRLMEMADTSPLSVLESVNGVISQRLVRRLVPGTDDQFSGRHPIHEVTQNSEALIDALMANTSRGDITTAAAATSTTFTETVDELIKAGITTREEARKVVTYV